MHALVYHGPGASAWETVPDPAIQEPGDALVLVENTTICGTDLHILKGDVPEVRPGTVLGHEAVGHVLETGSSVTGVQPGERVLVSCVSGCGRCRYCREASYGQCRDGGGWVLGHLVDGTQAEYVRVPHADVSLHPLPPAVAGEDAVLLSDIFPTAYEVGVLNGRVGPGDSVVIVGAGPVGLAAVATARLYSPGRIMVTDLAPSRLDAAKQVGADVTVNANEDPEGLVQDLTDGLGADVVMEAVGVPDTFEMCTRMVRPGGHVANIGVHGEPVALHLETLWVRNLTITTGLVDTFSTPMLLGMLGQGRLPTGALVTQHFTMDEMETAYDVFSRPADTGALKVVVNKS